LACLRRPRERTNDGAKEGSARSGDMELVRDGISRDVLLVGDAAIKIPTLRNGLKYFLIGWLGNHNEVSLSKTKDNRLCPIRASYLGCLVVVMARARVCTWGDYIEYHKYQDLPTDEKPDNYGVYRGQVVMIDYGAWWK
jgi:hypothetical protein